MLTHEAKFKKFSNVQMPDDVRKIFVDVGMLLLVDCSLTMIFVE